jgi:hypothetical protein
MGIPEVGFIIICQVQNPLLVILCAHLHLWSKNQNLIKTNQCTLMHPQIALLDNKHFTLGVLQQNLMQKLTQCLIS